MSGEVGRLQVRHGILVVVAGAVAAVIGRPGAWGTLLGGAMMALSVALYTAIVRLVVAGGRPRLAIGLLFAKLAAFLGLGWLAFASGSGRPDLIGFALGVTCFPAAVVWEAVQGKKD